MTTLATLLPPWMHEDGMHKLLAKLQDDQPTEKPHKEMEEPVDSENMVVEAGWDKIIISSVKTEKNKPLEGKSVKEISLLLGRKNEFTALRDLLLEEKREATIIMFSQNKRDVQYVMRGRYHTVGTDAWSTPTKGILSKGKPHPKSFGTYPRILGKYAREKARLRFQDAIRRMTFFPAAIAGLGGRGILREGFYANLAIFYKEKISDRTTFEDQASPCRQ